MKFRTESDCLGEVKIPSDKYWGPQTQRSLENFKIGRKKIPLEVIHALALVKKAAASANAKLQVLPQKNADLIAKVCDEILDGKLDDQFPLVVFQTGSGTQTNMNINEVIVNRGHVLCGGKLDDKEKTLHPNDDVNKSQSTNDVFPTATNIAVYSLIAQNTLPSLAKLRQELNKKVDQFKNIIKIGRTHFMDATPLTLGQEFSGYVSQLDHSAKTIENAMPHLFELPVGGTAVGTGINTPLGYDDLVMKNICKLTGHPFKKADNMFEAQASRDGIVEVSSALKTAAVSLMKIGNDIRMLGSGPRCGIGEINLPANEPGSSIMPGKVNPTQCEALTQICAQVIGNDTTITIAGMQGHFELQAFQPVMTNNIVLSAQILGDGCKSFTENCVVGIEANEGQIRKNLENSLMLVTALNPHIGYENSAKIAKKAYRENMTLREAAVELGVVTKAEFEEWVDPKKML